MPKEAEWAKRVEAWRSSGRPARDFCEGRGYSPKSLQWWAWKLRKSDSAARAIRPGVKLARVVMRGRDAERTTSSSIVLHVGGARVEVGAAADRAALSAVVDVLLSACRGRGA